MDSLILAGFIISFCNGQILTSYTQHSPTQRIPLSEPFILLIPPKSAVVNVLTFFVYRQCLVLYFFLATHKWRIKVISELLCGNCTFWFFFYGQKHMNRTAQKLTCQRWENRCWKTYANVNFKLLVTSDNYSEWRNYGIMVSVALEEDLLFKEFIAFYPSVVYKTAKYSSLHSSFM